MKKHILPSLRKRPEWERLILPAKWQNESKSSQKSIHFNKLDTKESQNNSKTQ